MRITGLLFAAASILPAVYGAAVPSEVERSLVERDNTATVVNAVKAVNTGVQKLDKAVTQVKSDNITVLLNVLTASNALTDTINTQSAKIKNVQPVDLIGALEVEVPTLQLVSSVQQLSKDLINIKKYVVQAGVTSIVLQTVQSQKATADSFADLLTTKIPSLVQGIATYHKGQIDDALNSVIKAYSS